jgi:hypothetical protein
MGGKFPAPIGSFFGPEIDRSGRQIGVKNLSVICERQTDFTVNFTPRFFLVKDV